MFCVSCLTCFWCFFLFCFFFNDTATTEIYTLSLHDALPIWLPMNGSIQRRLLGETTLALANAVSIANAMEMAKLSDSGEQNVTEAEGSKEHTEQEEVKLIRRQKGKSQSRSNVRCWCCGEQGHVKTDCKYKDQSCNNCGIKGHLRKVCRGQKEVKHVQNYSHGNQDFDDDRLVFRVQREIGRASCRERV